MVSISRHFLFPVITSWWRTIFRVLVLKALLEHTKYIFCNNPLINISKSKTKVLIYFADLDFSCTALVCILHTTYWFILPLLIARQWGFVLLMNNHWITLLFSHRWSRANLLFLLYYFRNKLKKVIIKEKSEVWVVGYLKNCH